VIYNAAITNQQDSTMAKDFDVSVIEEVVKAYGGVKQAQERLDYDATMTVYNWRQRGLPLAKIPFIHLHTDIPVSRLLEGVNGLDSPY
jgi:hypothetical protein